MLPYNRDINIIRVHCSNMRAYRLCQFSQTDFTTVIFISFTLEIWIT